MTVREARAAPSSPRARQGLRHRRTAAPRRVPLEPRHRGAARRRRGGQDARGRVVAGLPKSFKGDKSAQATEVGKLLAANAKNAGVEAVVFDRGGYLYHGRVKALADGAREGGLDF